METDVAREHLPGVEEGEPSRESLVQRASLRLSRLLRDDPEVASAAPSAEAIEEACRCPTTIETVAKIFELYADRRCLGARASERQDGVERWLPRFEIATYAEVWERVTSFASGLAHEDLVREGSFVGICGFGSPDWVEAYLACIYRAAVSVPLQTSMSSPELRQVAREAELECVVCSEEQLDAIAQILPDCPSIRSVVVMDRRDASTGSPAERQLGDRVVVRTMRQLEELGRARGIVPYTLPSMRSEPDPLMSLSYTSGSTGTPKGAMLSESLLRRHWQAGFFSQLSILPGMPHIALSYMPLNHAAGWGSLTTALLRGGVTYFVARSDMSTFFDDVQLARPTLLLIVPRVAQMIYQQFQREIVRRACGASDDPATRDRIAAEILSEMRDRVLGDRLLFLITSTAPTPPEIFAFLERCFRVPVVDGYGSTEAGPLTVDNRVVPRSGVTFRLVDVPELGYRTSDEPFPRGELHVKSPWLVAGYYKNPGATADLYDEEGYLNTGDIVEQRGPDTLVWVDRAKNVLKLSQGEFVATSRLEGLFASKSPFLRQVYLYGASHRSYLLAVVVPDVGAAEAHLRARGVEPDDASLKELVRAEVHRVAAEEALRPYEVPRDVLIEREPFTIDGGLLTNSAKPSRPKLRARYGERLEAMYQAIERAQLADLYGASRGDGATVAEKVKKAVAVTLGLPDLDPSQMEQSFLRLGGDSLSALDLEAAIEAVSGVRVPVGFLLDRTSSVRAVVDYVERSLAGGSRSVTFEDVHGRGAEIVRAEDLRIDAFLAPAEIDEAARAIPAERLPGEAEVALLTGANGFLGRFLALELLDRLAPPGRVYAVVRAPSDEAARERLVASYGTTPELVRRAGELLASGRLVAVAGDLMKPRLGLSSELWTRLSDEVDLVVHNGALVNHAFDYTQLFEPNVLGTVEMIRLAAARRIKSFAYLSTVGVMLGRQLPPGEAFREDEDIRSVFEARPIDHGYAAGYGTSKWASELLLRDASERLGVPVTVFRPSEILAHSTYPGQVNVPDFFTRLLVGIVYTGVAPKSFYAPGASARVRHHDGLPVDVVARSIVVPAVHRGGLLKATTKRETFHVVNPHHEDGASLDDIVDAIVAAGYRVERIFDYDEWLRTFHDRLTALGERERQRSPLPILRAWERPQADERVFDASRLLARLRAVSPELAELPRVDESIVRKTLDDLVALEVIAPARRGA